MKKWYLIMLTSIMILTGCNNEKAKVLDLEKLNAELPYISEDTFDILNVLSSVEYEKENKFENLIDIYEYDYDTLGISNENVAHGTVRMSLASAQMYMVFQAVSGKEEALISELENYLNTRKQTTTNKEDLELLDHAIIEHNDDFIALIVSKDNQEILERIKNTKSYLFGVLTPATDADLNQYGLSLNLVREYAIQKPVLTSAKTYLIVKPKDGKEDEVKTALTNYVNKLRNDYASIPSEAKLIEKALVSEIEGYQIVIISSDNEKVLEAIQTYLK